MRFACFKRSSYRMQFSTIDRLFEAENSLVGVGVAPDSASAMMRVTTVSSRAIRPDSSDPCTVH
eukprot:35313-Amphidinium_carterae.1